MAFRICIPFNISVILGKICKVIFLSVKILARIFWSLTALKKNSKDLLPAKYLDWNVTVFSVSQFSVCVYRATVRTSIAACCYAKALAALLTPQEFQWIFSACQTTVWTKGKSWEKTDSSDTKFKIYRIIYPLIWVQFSKIIQFQMRFMMWSRFFAQPNKKWDIFFQLLNTLSILS